MPTTRHLSLRLCRKRGQQRQGNPHASHLVDDHTAGILTPVRLQLRCCPSTQNGRNNDEKEGDALQALARNTESVSQAVQMRVANTEPAVPGPQGQKPLPKPVPMMTGSSGGRSSVRFPLLFIRLMFNKPAEGRFFFKFQCAKLR